MQYILFEDNQSDSELTFDEIQATLQNLRTNRKDSSKDTSAINEQSCKSQDEQSCIEREILNASPLTRTTESSSSSSSSVPSSPLNTTYRITKSKNAQTSSDNEADDRQRLIDDLTDSPPPQPRLKRSRKQQLTSMNRDGSEIIIQPASMLSEEELTGKKRGRRRRPRLPQYRATAYGHASKRIKKKKRQVLYYIWFLLDYLQKSL